MTTPAVLPIPQKGQTAPDFTLLTDEGQLLMLSSLRGRPVVLFFYPKDNTPACTLEACELRDAFPKFEDSGAVILGISPDSVAKHKRFRALFSLSYNLLADTDHAVAEQYGVWGQKMLFGRKYMGMLRTTFLIDSAGTITHVFEKVKVLGHASAVKAALAAQR